MRYNVQIAIVTFVRDVKAIRRSFIYNVQEPPELEAFVFNSIGEAVSLCLDIIKEHKQKCREYVIACEIPWIITITDGYHVGGSKEELNKAKNMIKDFNYNKKINSVFAAIGEQNEETNKHISELGDSDFFTIKSENIKELFEKIYNYILNFYRMNYDREPDETNHPAEIMRRLLAGSDDIFLT